MKKLKIVIVSLLILLGLIPYLFLFTSIEEVKNSQQKYDCHIETFGQIQQTIGFGSVYYRPLGNSSINNHRKVLPFFFQKGEVKYASCAGTEIALGSGLDFKIGDKITVYSELNEVKFLGYTIHSEKNWSSFGTADREDWVEGERVLKQLINDKEVLFFGGKKIKK